MNKLLLKTIYYVIFGIAFVVVLSAKTVSAQDCGSICGGFGVILGLNTCNLRPYNQCGVAMGGCQCIWDRNCLPNGNTCTHDSIISSADPICCGITPPTNPPPTNPPPTNPPPPPAGSCDSGSFCAYGIANCGVNGWVGGGGTCDGGICCKSGPVCSPPSCDSMTITTIPSNRTIGINEELAIRVRIQYSPKNVSRDVYTCASEDPDLNLLWPGYIGNTTRNSVCHNFGNPGTGDVTATLKMYGRTPGTTRVLITGNVRNDGCGHECTDRYITVNVETNPWWQVVGGAVISEGDITASIPSGRYFILGNSANYPGMMIFGGSKNIANSQVSTKRWSANSSFNTPVYSYDYFESIVSDSVVWNMIGTQNAAQVLTGQIATIPSSDGYHWIKQTGDVDLSSNVMLTGGRKVVLFVDGNLRINGNIRLNNSRNDFFMAIVSEITSVNPNGGIVENDSQVASRTTTTLALEGVFFSDGAFNTGNGNGQALGIRGSVVAGSIALGRNLGASNTTTPAETFEFAEEILLNYPGELSPKKLVWKEIAP